MRKIQIIVISMLALLFLMNVYYMIFDQQSYLQFVEKYLSPDNEISKPILVFASIQAIFLMCAVFLCVGMNIFSRKDLHKIDKITFLVVTVLFVLYQSHIWVEGLSPLYVEDGFFEFASALCALLASALLFGSMKYKKDKRTRIILMAVSMFFFFFGMEEISWGQRIFGWNTPDLLKDINAQQEMNVHNIFNPVMYVLHPVFDFLVFLFMISANKIRKKMESISKNEDYLNLVPVCEAPYYAGLFAMLMIQGAMFGWELNEEIISVIGLSYAIKQFFIYRKQKRVKVATNHKQPEKGGNHESSSYYRKR